MNSYHLEGRYALVCGASRGIGRAVATSLAREGATVIALARTESQLESLLSTLATDCGQAHSHIAVDISNDLEVLRAKVDELLSCHPIHILVNNSGGPRGGRLVDASVDQLFEAFRTHVGVSQSLVQWLSPKMKEANYGRVINIVSTSVRQPINGLGVSNVIRAAMSGWNKTLSNELAPDSITFNNILPGFTETERLSELIQNRVDQGQTREDVIKGFMSETPMGRFANPDEIAAAAVFLASPSASYITGASLAVDGGKIRSI